jgi:hypothetical protein
MPSSITLTQSFCVCVCVSSKTFQTTRHFGSRLCSVFRSRSTEPGGPLRSNCSGSLGRSKGSIRFGTFLLEDPHLLSHTVLNFFSHPFSVCFLLSLTELFWPYVSKNVYLILGFIHDPYVKNYPVLYNTLYEVKVSSKTVLPSSGVSIFISKNISV